MTSMSFVDRPVDGLDGDLGRAVAAEDTDEVEVGLRRDARSDLEVMGGLGVGVVRSGVGRTVGKDAEAGGRARNVRPVADAAVRERAVEWIGVRVRDERWRTGIGAAVVRISDEIDAALHLGSARSEQAGITGVADRRVVRIRELVGLLGPRAAEVRVRVVDAGVDHGDLDAVAGESEAGLGIPDLVRNAKEGNALMVVALDDLDAPDRDDIRQLGQRRNLVARGRDLDAVVRGLELRQDASAVGIDAALDGVLASLQLGLDLALLRL